MVTCMAKQDQDLVKTKQKFYRELSEEKLLKKVFLGKKDLITTGQRIYQV